MLSGLVIVTCMCGYVDPWAAVVCAAIAGVLYTGASWLLLRCGVDDPLDSSAVHFGSGMLGSIMVAFVANPKHVYALTGSPCGGVFYGHMGWIQLGLQLLAIMVVVVFAGGTAWIMFWVLNRRGLLRVDQTTELAGIDNMEHGGELFLKALHDRVALPIGCSWAQGALHIEGVHVTLDAFSHGGIVIALLGLNWG